MGLSIAAAAPETPAQRARVERALEQVLDSSYQRELPGYGSGAEQGPDAARMRRRPGGRIADYDDRQLVDTRLQEQGGGSPLASTLMWGLAIVIGAIMVFWLVSELGRFAGDPEVPLEDDDARQRLAAQVDAIIDRPLGDADELARRGDFAEAIHTLLLRTLQELARGAAVRIVPAMTSREVLARVPLLADARTALAGLITAVEITHFGDEPANAADYERCRQQFHVFATAFRGARA